MPKKSRRTKGKHRARLAKANEERQPQQLKPAPVKPQLSARASPTAQVSSSRYQYVMPEVKRIGILAGTIILILIVLSFVLA